MRFIHRTKRNQLVSIESPVILAVMQGKDRMFSTFNDRVVQDQSFLTKQERACDVLEAVKVTSVPVDKKVTVYSDGKWSVQDFWKDFQSQVLQILLLGNL